MNFLISRLALVSAALTLSLCTACGGGGGYAGTSVSPVNTDPVLEIFNTNLSGAQETPANFSMATGTGIVTLDSGTKEMIATVQISGLSATAAHVHEGALGVAGPVLFPLLETFSGSGSWKTTVTLTDTQITALRAGQYYFNIHSVAFPDGEIRGQIVKP
jgi:hypothetical protein